MQVWQKYLTQAIALHKRGKHLEESLKWQSLEGSIPPIQLLQKQQTAKEARALYNKALRICALLAETQDEDSTVDMNRMQHILTMSLRRIDFLIQLLNAKAKKWGLAESVKIDQDIEEAMPNTVDEPSPETLPRFEDANANADGMAINVLRQEIKHSLKALSNIIDYMERPNLLKIHREINKLVNY